MFDWILKDSETVYVMELADDGHYVSISSIDSYEGNIVFHGYRKSPIVLLTDYDPEWIRFSAPLSAIFSIRELTKEEKSNYAKRNIKSVK
jgi:hypothetical protein